MKILLTGGAGFIGSHIIEEFSSETEFLVVDNLSTGHKSNIESYQNVTLHEKSVTDYVFIKNLFNEYKFDAIIHLAAIASVFKCVEEPFESSEVNFRASINLMELAYKNGVDKFIFASSAAIYGDDVRLPKSELDSTTLPISTYGVDKFASEQFLMDYSRRNKLNGTAFRFFNVFGERQDPASPYSGVLSIFTDRVITDQNSVKIFGDGRQTRDFIYVKDIVSAIKLATDSDELSGNVYNLGTGIETSLLDVVSDLETIYSKEINIDFSDERLGDIKRSVADISKIGSTGWKPKFTFRQGLDKYFSSL